MAWGFEKVRRTLELRSNHQPLLFLSGFFKLGMAAALLYAPARNTALTIPVMINGYTLRRLRLQKRFTQRQAAQRLHISLAAYRQLEQSAWLHGTQLHSILATLGCTTADVEKALALLN